MCPNHRDVWRATICSTSVSQPKWMIKLFHSTCSPTLVDCFHTPLQITDSKQSRTPDESLSFLATQKIAGKFHHHFWRTVMMTLRLKNPNWKHVETTQIYAIQAQFLVTKSVATPDVRARSRSSKARSHCWPLLQALMIPSNVKEHLVERGDPVAAWTPMISFGALQTVVYSQCG